MGEEDQDGQKQVRMSGDGGGWMDQAFFRLVVGGGGSRGVE